MKITTTPLAGLLLLEPRIFPDDRGYFYECFHQARFGEQGLPAFVQDNASRSRKHVLRGLHYQLPNAQGKLVGVTQGEIWDVAVDVRRSSPTFGQWYAVTLSDTNHLQLYVPPGFAHGFCVLSEQADVYYKCSALYTPASEHGIRWNDPRLNIAWPVKTPLLSAKDAVYPTLDEISHEHLFA